jgi:hypothetical protein
MLFTLRNKHNVFPLQLTTTQRSGGCKLIDGRRVDSLRHAGPNQIRSS